MDIVPPASFGEFLSWLGTSAVIGSIVSWVAAHWVWFKNQGGGTKVAVLLVIATVLGLVSHLAITYVPAGVVEEAQPYYTAFLNAAMIVFGAMGFNYLVNERAERKDFLAAFLGLEEDAEEEEVTPVSPVPSGPDTTYPKSTPLG